MLFLRTAADGQEMLIFAAVVHDVAGRTRATEVLNDLNVEARWVKFQLVVTGCSLPCQFLPSRLCQLIFVRGCGFSDVADGIDNELAIIQLRSRMKTRRKRKLRTLTATY